MKIIIATFCFLFINSYCIGQFISKDIQKVEIGCLDLNGLPKELIINSEDELDYILTDNRSPHPQCVDIEMPDIDFNSNTLIGVKVSVGGCAPPEVSIEFKKIGNKIQCLVSVKINGICRALHQDAYWFQVNKIKSEDVLFEYVKQ